MKHTLPKPTAAYTAIHFQNKLKSEAQKYKETLNLQHLIIMNSILNLVVSLHYKLNNQIMQNGKYSQK